MIPNLPEIILALTGGMIAVIFTRISGDIKEMTRSVNELNIKIAQVILKLDHHEIRLNRLEDKKNGTD